MFLRKIFGYLLININKGEKIQKKSSYFGSFGTQSISSIYNALIGYIVAINTYILHITSWKSVSASHAAWLTKSTDLGCKCDVLSNALLLCSIVLVRYWIAYCLCYVIPFATNTTLRSVVSYGSFLRNMYSHMYKRFTCMFSYSSWVKIVSVDFVSS